MPFKPIPLANLGACDMLLQPSTYNIRGSLIGSTELLHALIFDQEFRNLLQPKSRCKRLDLYWPQWVHFGSQEHHGISQNPMESHGRFWNMTESSGC
jgi:hypothetical protein